MRPSRSELLDIRFEGGLVLLEDFEVDRGAACHAGQRIFSDFDHEAGAIGEHWPSVTGEQTVIHGDAHRANWWPERADWWMLIDPEFLSLGPAVYDLAPLEVTERRLGLGPSRFSSFQAGYESLAGRIDPAALAAAIRVRELLSVAWLASRVGEDSQIAVRARHRLSDALCGRDGSWLA